MTSIGHQEFIDFHNIQATGDMVVSVCQILPIHSPATGENPIAPIYQTTIMRINYLREQNVIKRIEN